MKTRPAVAPRMVTIGFSMVLLGVVGIATFAGHQGQSKDAAAVLVFQQASPLNREDILGCLQQSRPTSLNLSRPERINSLFASNDYGTFGPLSLHADDLHNPARHIVARVTDDGAIRKLEIWTRPDAPLTPTDVAVLKSCTVATLGKS